MPGEPDFDVGRYEAFAELEEDTMYQERRPAGCDWCGDRCGHDYIVVVQTEEYGVCPLCWGRSPTYLELRQEGMRHEAALRQIGIAASE